MYPVISIESVIQHATNLFRFLEAASRTGLASETNPSNERLTDTNANILKMILANALTVEGSGQSELGNRLFESVRDHTSLLMQHPDIDIKSLPLLAIVVSHGALDSFKRLPN